MNLMAFFNYQMFLLLVSNKIAFSKKTDYNKLEDNLIGTMKEIRSEIKGLHNNLKEVKTSVDTFYLETNALRSNQNSLDLKLENVISRVKEIEEISKDTRNEIGFCRDYNKVEENLIGTMKEIRSEIKGLHNNLKEVKTSVDTFYLETKNLTDLVLNKTFYQSENGKKILSNKENLTDLVFNKTSYQSENEKKILSNKENLTDLVLNKTSSQSENEKNNLSNKDLPKTIEGHKYFVTPEMNWHKAVSYCKDHGGKPFVPKTQDEFKAYVALVPKTGLPYAWYPVNDIEEEGHLVLYDGTDYEKASYKLQKWIMSCPPCVDVRFPNTEVSDCVGIDNFGEAFWDRCYSYKYVLLCKKN